ncbi:sugar porter family MFS transporter [Rheinheimera aquimaris]|uniref:Sugar porter family MFS transporter n=1 Tax=Rheinheimera aquimaris TaxID=412437 RepID=A0ABP3P7R4_9GAMM|nr:sugar porter family MFS transporter [Rheinheimera aquimaris]MCB5215027.1 sugar porter family MFS transporter [Rheinheimera aquimaris]
MQPDSATLTTPATAAAEADNRGFILFITVVATLGGFLFGYDSGVINGTVDGLQLAFNSESAGTGFNVASMLLGCAVGAFFAGRLADILGRRTLLQIAAVCFVISAWGSGIAESSLEFVLYRILGGLAVGAASVMAPAYISEVAPARYRGMLTTVQQIAIIFGLFMAFISNYLLAKFAGASTSVLWLDYSAWRWMFWMELLPAVLFLLMLLFIPESPRFLVLKGKTALAAQVLRKLYGDAAAARKQVDIEQSLSSNHQPRLSDLIDKPSGKLRRIVWVGIGLATFQQLVGINVVFYYGAVLWQAVGFSESDALLINVISGALSIAACVITLLVIDKIGRKPLLKWGSVGMSLTLALMVLAFANAEQDASGRLLLGDWGIVALISANAYVFFFNMSWGPVMWVMLGEMFPNQIRGSGLAVSGLAQWGSNFLITMTFPLLLSGIGLAGAYGLYTLGAVLSVWFVARMVHETKGKELEDMPG